ncbi:MAG TPA: hypothetical protein VG248_02860 [Caulobacteraceae bacterium]|jgi:hypothetical protein|nr:hypothetical protein [Caulobacteraceae bacterium]
MIWIVILGVSVLSSFAFIGWWIFREKESSEDWLFDTEPQKHRPGMRPTRWQERAPRPARERRARR